MYSPYATNTSLTYFLKFFHMFSSPIIKKYGTPGGTRTPYLLLRRQLLYPAELLAHLWSGKRDSNPQQPVWKTGTLPLSYYRKHCVGFPLLHAEFVHSIECESISAPPALKHIPTLCFLSGYTPESNRTCFPRPQLINNNVVAMSRFHGDFTEKQLKVVTFYLKSLFQPNLIGNN